MKSAKTVLAFVACIAVCLAMGMGASRVLTAYAQVRQPQDIFNAWDTSHLVECFNDTILPGASAWTDTIAIGRRYGHPTRLTLFIDVDTIKTLGQAISYDMHVVHFPSDTDTVAYWPLDGSWDLMGLLQIPGGVTTHSLTITRPGGEFTAFKITTSGDTLAFRLRLWMLH